MRMMNILLSMALAPIAATAQEAAPQPPSQEQVTAPSPMATAIAQTSFITNKKPSTKAKYYMYLASASWCGPCRRVTPALVGEYPNMMANNEVEVILLSCDRTPEAAQKYLEHYNAPFAAVMYGSPEAAKLPGCPTDIRGIPHIVLVDASGKLIYRGHGLRFAEWKLQIQNVK